MTLQSALGADSHGLTLTPASDGSGSGHASAPVSVLGVSVSVVSVVSVVKLPALVCRW
jgi:hypothetical protein